MILIFSLWFMINSSTQLKPITYTDGNQKLMGYSIQPKKVKKSKGGVLILPAWKGIDEHAKKTAEKLAQLGYHAFVADIYGEGNNPKDIPDAAKLSGYYKKNYTDYQRRIRLALEQLIKIGANPQKIVVIGYCFGGTGALEAARADMPVKGVVSFHGGLGKDSTRVNSKIDTKVLVLHGLDDPFVKKEEVIRFKQEMEDSKADWQLVGYANAVHSFTDPAAGNDKSKGAAYNEKADKRSWNHFLLFLNETLTK